MTACCLFLQKLKCAVILAFILCLCSFRSSGKRFWWLLLGLVSSPLTAAVPTPCQMTTIKWYLCTRGPGEYICVRDTMSEWLSFHLPILFVLFHKYIRIKNRIKKNHFSCCLLLPDMSCCPGRYVLRMGWTTQCAWVFLATPPAVTSSPHTLSLTRYFLF